MRSVEATIASPDSAVHAQSAGAAMAHGPRVVSAVGATSALAAVTQIPRVVSAVAAASALALAACAPPWVRREPAGGGTSAMIGQAVPTPGPSPTATPEGYPALGYPPGWATRPLPTHGPSPTPEPTRTPVPTPDYAAALPPGATLRSVEPAAAYRWFVLYDLEGRPGLALVEHEPIWHESTDGSGMGWEEPNPLPPRLLWDFSDEPAPGYELRDLRLVDVQRLSGVAGGPAVIASGAGRRELLVLDREADQPVVTHRLPLDLAPEGAPRDLRLLLARIDITGDGTPDPMLFARNPGEASSGTVVLYQGNGPAPAREVLRTAAMPLVIDVDQDGTYEVVESERTGSFRVRSWNGTAYEDEATLVENRPAAPRPVTDGRLPPLPADLFFVRPGDNAGNGGIWRWPRGGGALDHVADCAEFHDCIGLSASDDGGVIATGLGWRDGPEQSVDGVRVIDTRTGAEQRLDLGLDVEGWGHFAPAQWALAPDGRSLVYVAYPATRWTPTPADLYVGRPAAPIVVADTRDLSRASVIATCGTYYPGPDHGTEGCLELCLSRDGRSVAYSDGRGLWIVPVAGGGPRLLVQHHYGVGEADVRRYTLSRWSTSGARAIVDTGYYEGLSSNVMDVASGSMRPIENSRYASAASDFAWLPDDNAFIHARAGGSEAGSPVVLVDAADPTRTKSLLPLVVPLAAGQGLNAIAPHAVGTGTVCFGLRHSSPDAYRGNGVSCVGVDGTNWRTIADLPAMVGDSRENEFATGDPGTLRWSRDGAAFAFDQRSYWSEAADARPARRDTILIGRSDGSALWDATDLLGDGRDFTWAP